MHFDYTTSGVCSQRISFELNDNKVSKITFLGGCDGNLKAIGKLLEGEDAKKTVAVLKGNTCGYKSTSCADQLARAIEDAMVRIQK